MRKCSLCLAWIALSAAQALGADAVEPQLARDVLSLVKTRCVKCHGPAKREGKLNLSTAAGMARGGESGAAIAPGSLDGSLLWQRIAADEMPPEDPLNSEEKATFERWIAGGARGLSKVDPNADPRSDHWAFGPLSETKLPNVLNAAAARTDVDHFILAELEARGLAPNEEADRATLIRRVSFDLTGLPPTPEEIRQFSSDMSADAYEQMVERYLASPHYGERWGKFWLDAAGYADSNGYFNADTDRPLAYRYRDYVVRALNQDMPFDRFVLEQLAGDELSGFVPGQDATSEMISLLEATHYLRNGQDGSGESDGNADEVRIDRYFALEATTQIVASSLLGLTLQCAKCHDHKFEPVSQRDYYQMQAVFYPAFDIRNWLKPNERFVFASLPGQLARWEDRAKAINSEIATLKTDFAEWVRTHRLPSTVLFRDEFDDSALPLAARWSNTAPGDDAPGGEPAVEVDSQHAPGAAAHGGVLTILETGAAGDRWLSTKQSFDWTPEGEGQWIQATFDLVDDRVADGAPAARIAYFIALHDFNDNSPVSQGNILIDGNPDGGAAVHLDYPGSDVKAAGVLGNGKYQKGHNYGVRITNQGDGNFLLEHLVDSVPDEKIVKLRSEDLPDGGFGFEYCCGRSFQVDNVLIERGLDIPPAGADAKTPKRADALRDKQKELAAAIKAKEQERGEKPGKIACVVDRSETPPDVFLLERGNYATPGEKVEPAPLAALSDGASTLDIKAPASGAKSSGRRLAWALWLTRPNARPAALLARVQVNRIWQHHFGSGIVATTENLGTSGAAPSHPDLLEYLAGQFVRSGWSIKAMHRLMLSSAAYRRTSASQPKALELDPDNRLLWRWSLKRLDAESLRDAMLAVSGRLDRAFGGPYIPTTRDDLGEVLIKPDTPGAMRRSIYLQQRRTQTVSLLGVFDSPTIVFNCIERRPSTMPLQSLSLLNSEFVVTQASHFAARLAREAGQEAELRIELAFLLALGRRAAPDEVAAGLEFIRTQRSHYQASAEAETKAWSYSCQMLLASNSFLYVE